MLLRVRINFQSFGLLFSLLLITSSFAQEFTVLGKRYKQKEEGTWYTYFDGRFGDEIIPDRLIIRPLLWHQRECRPDASLDCNDRLSVDELL